MGLVYGVGINDGSISTVRNGKIKPEYRAWKGMLERCHSDKLHLRRPTYIGCYTSENFKFYSYFHDWCQKQIGFGVSGFELDKDLLIKGNKEYSENTCVFIPHEINSMMTKTDAKRGSSPIGVSFHKRLGKYQAKMTRDGLDFHIGYFDFPDAAYMAYKREREKYIQEIAERYRNVIDTRVYNALMNYEVEIID